MVDSSSILPKDMLELILSAINTLIILIGVPIAIINLVAITRTHHLQAVSQFMQDLAATADDRRFIYREFCFAESTKPISAEAKTRADNVINFLNRVGLLIENRLLSPEMVLSICHTVIIRCWYKIGDYVRYQESLLGGRYGRRLERLVERAKAFHDIRPHQRWHPVLLDDGSGRPMIIYQTEVENGCGVIKQRFVWFIKRILRIY